jgi:hypothetical protein
MIPEPGIAVYSRKSHGYGELAEFTLGAPVMSLNGLGTLPLGFGVAYAR